MPEKLAEIMADNLYDLIPGYQDIEEAVHTMTTQIEEIQSATT